MDIEPEMVKCGSKNLLFLVFSLPLAIIIFLLSIFRRKERERETVRGE